MKKYVLETMNAVQKYIDEEMKNAPAEKTAEMLSEFETKISYFQHERLIHLIVTVLFGLATVITIPAYLVTDQVALLILGGLFLCLLFPYIIHYFHLENGVQQLYLYYNQLEMTANPGFKKIY